VGRGEELFFKCVGVFTDKQVASDQAKDWRSDGYYARVVRSGHNIYELWVAEKPNRKN